jgi:hypothetical protein
VGDDLWQRFQRAEKEMEEELRDVVTEVCFPSPRKPWQNTRGKISKFWQFIVY